MAICLKNKLLQTKSFLILGKFEWNASGIWSIPTTILWWVNKANSSSKEWFFRPILESRLDKH